MEKTIEHFPLHSWKMELFIKYHVTIISQLNDQNLMRYDIINNASNFLLRQPIRLLESHYLLKKLH